MKHQCIILIALFTSLTNICINAMEKPTCNEFQKNSVIMHSEDYERGKYEPLIKILFDHTLTKSKKWQQLSASRNLIVGAEIPETYLLHAAIKNADIEEVTTLLEVYGDKIIAQCGDESDSLPTVLQTQYNLDQCASHCYKETELSQKRQAIQQILTKIKEFSNHE